MTGANSGLGFATAKQLAERGAKVYMLCRDKERGEAARKEIRGETELKIVDMSKWESIMGLEMEEEVDVMVHNAGAMYSERASVKWPKGEID